MSDKKKAFTGIPLISATLEGNTLHLRNDGDAPAIVRGAVLGYRDEAGNFIATEHAIHSVESFELALDPFERIELAAAAWRNAYRAHERCDREALERHLREAVDHGVELIRGLYG